MIRKETKQLDGKAVTVSTVVSAKKINKTGGASVAAKEPRGGSLAAPEPAPSVPNREDG